MCEIGLSRKVSEKVLYDEFVSKDQRESNLQYNSA
jgi:hypothetical protein